MPRSADCAEVAAQSAPYERIWMKFLIHPDGREEVLYCASVDDGWTDETPFSIIRLVLECKSDYKLLGKLEAYLVQTARESH